ncbi:MAG: methionyl-tRNA formyltransferase [Phycisphaerales bacterium]
MDLVFFGSGEFGLPTLQALAKTHTLRCIVTQPDRPAGRSRVLTPTPIGAWAAGALPGVPLIKPENVSEPSVLAQVRGVPAQAWVVIAFGQKLSRGLLEGKFAMNLHASLLPRWRGAAPINHAVLAGDEETGNSVITLADKMDAGLVLGQSRRPLNPLYNAGELHDLLARDGPALVLDVLRGHDSNALTPQAQDESKVTLAGKLSREDSWVDFSDEAEMCRRRIHGLTPWPGVSVKLNGVELKLLKAHTETDHKGEPAVHTSGALPGELLDRDAGLVACGEATMLRLLEVQPAGKRPMSWHAFAMGHTVQPGDRLLCS